MAQWRKHKPEDMWRGNIAWRRMIRRQERRDRYLDAGYAVRVGRHVFKPDQWSVEKVLDWTVDEVISVIPT